MKILLASSVRVWKPGRKKFFRAGQTAAAGGSCGEGGGAQGQDRGQLDRGIIRRTPGGSLAQLAAVFAAGGNAMSSFQVGRLLNHLIYCVMMVEEGTHHQSQVG